MTNDMCGIRYYALSGLSSTCACKTQGFTLCSDITALSGLNAKRNYRMRYSPTDPVCWLLSLEGWAIDPVVQ
jgi:hypothetical protein